MAKTVCDCRGSKGISKGESDEQQRNWSEKQWKNRHANPGFSYDKTRARLNFEIVNGEVREIDRSMSIDGKIRAMCKARGMRYPNDPNPRRRPGDDDSKVRERNVAAQLILSGSTERMNAIAFGSSQAVDFRKGADNSSVTRTKDIEEWAKDTYRFLARRYGEQNIVSFYVHLDESWPHCHATVLPVAQIKGKERVSWRSVFGGEDKKEVSEKFTKLHNDYYQEVGRKWGFERGTPISETGAKHRSFKEWRNEVVDEAKKAEKACKGLATMIANLERQRDGLLEELEQLQTDSNAGMGRMEELKEQIRCVDGKLEDKRHKLEEAERQLAGLMKDKDYIGDRVETLKQELSRTTSDGQQVAMSQMAAAFLQDAVDEFKDLLPKMSRGEESLFDDTVLKEMTDKGREMMIVGVMLYLGYLDQATTFAAGHGGGGGAASDLPWGRDPNEDDRHWAMRCARMARGLMEPAKIRMKR